MRWAAQLASLLGCSAALGAVISTPEEGSLANEVLRNEDSILTPLKPYHVIHECVNTTSADGVFYIQSTGRQETCGLYLFSAPDTVIQVDVEYAKVPCQTGGLIALLDGWEMNGELFPPASEHGLPLPERVQEFCGTGRPENPRRHLLSSQNMALLQYRLPAAGSFVSVHVRHRPNPAPCNQLMDGSEVYTLRNHGRRQNCTLLSISPVDAQLASVNVGDKSSCGVSGWHDYLETGETAGLDTSLMSSISRTCGHSRNNFAPVTSCGSMLVVRLVSSGRSKNVVEVRARPLTIQEVAESCFSAYDLNGEMEQALADYGSL